MYEAILKKLAKSKFRRQFILKAKDLQYIECKGVDIVERHAHEIIAQRIASANPRNDGKQTPMRGHPVFVAQHATACCCRQCLYKWHNISPGRDLTTWEQNYIVGLVMFWIKQQIET